MKKQFPLLFFFSILFFLQPLSAQIDFAPVGAKWWHEYWVLEPWLNHYVYESTGDTLLGGKDARIIELTSHATEIPTPIPEATIFLTSDEDRVYSWIRDSFYLLYDFSAQVGDTLSIGVNPANGYYAGHASPIYEEDTSKVNFFRVVVDSVFTIAINNESFRSYSVIPAPLHPDFVEATFGFAYLPGGKAMNEKFGFYGYGGPLGSGTILLTAGNAGQFRCYHDPTYAYPTADTTYCDTRVFVEAVEESEAFDFQLFPNPNQDGLLFVKGVSKGSHLQIIDFSGRRLSDQILAADQARFALDISFLENGMYWIKVQTKEGLSLTKKIMVLHH